ncbi:SufE-like protein 1, chloroplastic/mitochondrial [Glycine max]|nr:SufE-like protein 1, chloroplastic/mitochondrial [Glycine max]
MATNSITSSSFRIVSTRIRLSLFRKTPLLLPFPTKVFFSKPITFHRLQPSSSSPSASLQPIEDLPPKLQEIVHLFQSVPEPKAKYEQLVFYGKNLKPLEPQFKTNDNKADSDSGLAALLVQDLSGRPVNEIIRVTPDFVTLLGLQQSLTPSRNNGFLNMLKLMQRKALMLYVEAEKGGDEFAELNS